MVKRPLTRSPYALGLRARPAPMAIGRRYFGATPATPGHLLDTLEPPPSTALLSAEDAKARLRGSLKGSSSGAAMNKGSRPAGTCSCGVRRDSCIMKRCRCTSQYSRSIFRLLPQVP